MKRFIALCVILILGIVAFVSGIFNPSNLSEGPGGIILFFLIIVTEVVIAPIPGGFIGYVGAGIFGFWTAWPIMYLGNIVGCTISFWLARWIGTPFVNKVTSQKQRDKWHKIIDEKKYWLIPAYAVPILPIDIISIVAGVSKLRFRVFAAIAFPSLLCYTAITAFVGSFLADLIPFFDTIAVVAAIIFVIIFAYVIITQLRK